MIAVTLLFFFSRLQSGMNLQICFVNDSGSDKDSDADDSKTETSLDTPLSPMVSFAVDLISTCRSFRKVGKDKPPSSTTVSTYF